MQPLQLYHFSHNCDLKQWKTVNDSVMGGISTSSIVTNAEGKGVFTGTVSLENSGGFCAVKHTFNTVQVQNLKAFALLLKGDGKPYQFRVKNKVSDAHSYVFAFETTTNWQTVLIPFHALQATFRGQKLNLPAFDGAQLEEIMFLVSNKISETFTLIIDQIDAE